MNTSGSLPSKKRSGLKLLAIPLTIVVLVSVFHRVETAVLVATLRKANLAWWLLAHGSFFLAMILCGVRWQLMLRLCQLAVHYGAAMRLTLIGHFLSSLLFGVAGGDMAKAGLYAKWFRHPMPAVLSSCALERLVGGAGLILLFALGGFIASFGEIPSIRAEFTASPYRVKWISGLLAVLLGGILLAYLRWKSTSPLRQFLETFRRSLEQLMRQPRLALVGVVSGFAANLLISGVFAASFLAVSNERPSVLPLLWVFPTISLIASAPVTFAGTGIREGSALVLLGFYGVTEADALAAALLVSAVYLCWFGVGGFLCWLEIRRQNCFAVEPEIRTISAVIPTLNEAEALPQTLEHLRRIPQVCEIIVSDGGSRDATCRIAREAGCRVVSGARGRGGQLRHGASLACGDVVVLIHADTWLPPEAGQGIIDCLRDRTVVGGGFWKQFRNPSPLMLGSRARCAVRLQLAGRVLGDQAVFVRRSALQRIGGVPALPLMEEFELCRRLRKVGRLALAPVTVTTSARRFAKLGVWRTYARVWRVTIQYYLGASPETLRRIYERD